MATEAQQIWLFNMNFRASREKYWRPKVYANIQQMIKDATAFATPAEAIAQINFSIDRAPIAKTIQAIYIDAGKVAGGHSYQAIRRQVRSMQKALMPINLNEELVNEIIQYFNNFLLEKVVLPITDTMRAWILKQLIEGQQKSWSMSMIVDQIAREGFPRNRAFVITRTEVMRAANYGSRQGAKKAGFALRKYWISAQDDRTRRTPKDLFNHVAMNGIKTGIDEPFNVPKRDGGTEQLQQPGDPAGSAADVIQCRCTLGYEVLRDAQGNPVAA